MARQPLQCGLAWPFQPCFLMLPTLSPCAEYTGSAADCFKAAKPDMAQKIVSGLHFRSRSLYGPGLGVEYCVLGARALYLEQRSLAYSLLLWRGAQRVLGGKAEREGHTGHKLRLQGCCCGYYVGQEEELRQGHLRIGFRMFKISVIFFFCGD